jgi:hypothetical protein
VVAAAILASTALVSLSLSSADLSLGECGGAKKAGRPA